MSKEEETLNELKQLNAAYENIQTGITSKSRMPEVAYGAINLAQRLWAERYADPNVHVKISLIKAFMDKIREKKIPQDEIAEAIYKAGTIAIDLIDELYPSAEIIKGEKLWRN